MKFTVLVDFKDGRAQFEEGNSHDSGKVRMSDDHVKDLHAAGLVHLDGQPDQELTNTPKRIAPADVEMK